MVIKRYAAKSRATPKPPVFTCKWDTTQAGSSNDTVVLPLVNGGSYNFQVDWGDGTRETITAWNQSEKTHQYASTGIYEVRLIGGISGWYFGNGGDDDKIVEISSWGPLTITNGYRAFYGCSNLELTATDAPTLVLTSEGMRDMFYSCPNMGNQGNMNFWDVSNVTRMSATFYNSSTFNQDIGNWDVSNVTLMNNMFGNGSFNNGGSTSINNWDTSSCIDMRAMFSHNTGFNQPIGSWDTSSVTDMSYMFSMEGSNRYGIFDQDIGSWDVSNVQNFDRFMYNRHAYSAFNNGGSPSINGWDTSSATNMSYMFYRCTGFNQPIGNWDTSKVTSMHQMLNGANSFNQDLGGWDMTGVTDLRYFFYNNPVFNNGGSTGINNWRPSSCTRMDFMFFQATGFNQPIGDWDTSSATNMSYMFQCESSSNHDMIFDQDIGSWDVSNVQSFNRFMYNRRADSAFNNGGSPSISGWDTSSATNMEYMFYRCTGFNQPIGNWDTSKVTSMHQMLNGANSFNQDLGGWDMTGVTDLRYFFYNNPVFNNGGSTGINNWRPSSCTRMDFMFFQATGFNQPIGDWDTSSATNMSYMFQCESSSNHDMIFDQDIGSWDVSNVQSFNRFMYNRRADSAFNNGGSPSISGWDTSSATNMEYMFYRCTGFNQPIGNWDTSKVTSMRQMLNGANSFNQDLGGWDMTGVTDLRYFFYNNPVFNNGGSTGINNWRPSSCTRMDFMFFQATGFNQPIGDWDTSSATNMNGMFQCESSSNHDMIFDQDIGSWDVSNVQSFNRFMYNRRADSAFNNGGSPSISGWDTSSATNMEYMFYRCTGFNQPIGNWDTSKVTNMYHMLNGANSFNQDLGGWDMTGVTDLRNFFHNNQVFNNGGSTGINNWRPSSCTRMDMMFFQATGFNQPIGDWDTSSVTHMSQMFYSEYSNHYMIFDQDIGSWDVSNVQNFNSFMRNRRAYSAFNNGGSSSISGWDTSSATNMDSMFQNCTGFNQSLAGWDVSNITNASSFMAGCTLSTTNYDSTLGGWSSQSVQNGVNIHFGNSQYSSATGAAYRTALVNAGWTITDGGQA